MNSITAKLAVHSQTPYGYTSPAVGAISTATEGK